MELEGTGMDILSRNELKAVGSNFGSDAMEQEPRAEKNLKSNSTMGLCWYVGAGVGSAVGTAVVGTAVGVSVGIVVGN